MTDQLVFFEKITKNDRPQVGDLFCYKLVDGPFGFGRVNPVHRVIGGRGLRMREHDGRYCVNTTDDDEQ